MHEGKKVLGEFDRDSWQHGSGIRVDAKSGAAILAYVAELEEALSGKTMHDARNEALEEAATYCETHMMAVPYRGNKPTHDIYVSDEIRGEEDIGMSRHQGYGYAAAIRALKT